MINLTSKILLNIIKSRFGITFVVFVSAQILFLLFSKWRYGQAFLNISGYFDRDHIISSQSAFFLACIHLLIASNTVLFLMDVHHITDCKYKFGEEYVTTRQDIDRGYTLVFSAAIFGLIASAVIIGQYVRLFYHEGAPKEWIPTLEVNEYALIFLFTVFYIMDGKLFDVYEKCLRDGPSAGLGEKQMEDIRKWKRVTGRYILACDVPGLLGVVLLWLLGQAVSLEHRDLPHFDQLQFYVHGFIVGSMGLHMVFSQSVLAFLGEINDEIVR